MSLSSQVAALATRVATEFKAVRATLAGKAVILTPTATKTAAYTVAAGELALMNVPGGGNTLTLPASPNDKDVIGFRAVGSTTALPLTINRGGTVATIGDSGATSVTEPLSGVTRSYQYEAANTRWLPIADVKPLAALDGRYAALLNAEGIVLHNGTTAGGTRPSGYAVVRWIGGTTRPTNMLSGDIWEHFDAVTTTLNAEQLNLTKDWSTTTPTAPTGGISVFDRWRARRVPAYIDQTGHDSQLQTAFFSNRIGRLNAINGSATPTLDGLSVTNITTPTALSVANTNFYSSLVKQRMTSSTTAGTAAGTRTPAQWLLSSTANMGGFFFVCRFGLGAVTATNRIFVGMSATTGALSATTEPSAFLSMVGFGCDSTDTTQMYFMSNDASGTATKVALGTSFPSQGAGTNFYEFRLFAPSATSSRVFWSAHQLNGGIVVQGEATTDLPAAGTLLAAHLHHSNGSTAAAVSMDLQSLYIESDN
jgi:hypothetical protein